MSYLNLIDRDELMERIDDDIELLEELYELFIEDCPELLKEIQDGITNNDSVLIKRAAHTLKGAVGNFCAPTAFEASRKLEMLGATGDLSNAQAEFERLNQEIGNVTAALKELIDETA